MSGGSTARRSASYIRAVEARRVLGLLVATIALGVVLLLFFEPDVQTVDARELVREQDDARAFLIADYGFIALYALLSPLVQRRFGAALGGAGLGRWLRWAPLALVAAGAADAVENALLLSATDARSESAVDAAHAVAIPKVVFFIAGALLSLAVLARAIQTLRR